MRARVVAQLLYKKGWKHSFSFFLCDYFPTWFPLGSEKDLTTPTDRCPTVVINRRHDDRCECSHNTTGKKTWKNFLALNGIWTHDLWDTSTILSQLGYQSHMDIYKMADGSLPVSLSWSFKMTTVSNALPWGHCVHIIKIPTQRTEIGRASCRERV